MMLPHLQAAFAATETAKHHALRLKKQDIGSLALGICIGLDLGEAAALVLGAARTLSGFDLLVEVAETDAIERLMAGEFDAAVLAPGEDGARTPYSAATKSRTRARDGIPQRAGTG